MPVRLLLSLALLLTSAHPLNSQTACTPKNGPPAARTTPKPAATPAPGAAPNKVWVNTASNVYHCPGDRYYGKTKAGKYLTEPEAKAAGAHGERGASCFK